MMKKIIRTVPLDTSFQVSAENPLSQTDTSFSSDVIYLPIYPGSCPEIFLICKV